MPRVLTALAALSVWLAACAVFAPEPCTPEWLDYQADRAFAPVRKEYRQTLRDLRDANRAIDRRESGVDTAVALAAAAGSGIELLGALHDRSLPRLHDAAKTCADPEFVRRAVRKFLDEEGIDEVFGPALASLAQALDRLLAE